MNNCHKNNNKFVYTKVIGTICRVMLFLLKTEVWCTWLLCL